jgi:hypothetical protein
MAIPDRGLGERGRRRQLLKREEIKWSDQNGEGRSKGMLAKMGN